VKICNFEPVLRRKHDYTNLIDMKLETKDVIPNTYRTQAVKRAEKLPFSDLDIQTHPSEGPNTSSL